MESASGPLCATCDIFSKMAFGEERTREREGGRRQSRSTSQTPQEDRDKLSSALFTNNGCSASTQSANEPNNSCKLPVHHITKLPTPLSHFVPAPLAR